MNDTNILKMDNLAQKTNNIIKSIESDINNYSNNSNITISKFSNVESNIINKFDKEVTKLEYKAANSLDLINYKNNILKERYDFLRITNTPFNYLWYKYLQRKEYKSLPLSMQKGAHFIVALMGGGKSSFIYHTIEKLRIMFGYGAYVNVDLEYPHFDPILQEYVHYHNRFEIEDYWGTKYNEETEKDDYVQYKRFNKLYPVLVLDEWLSKMNHRVNNTGGYKDIFIPFMKSVTHMRHQGINQIYVASQMDQTDIQLMSMFKYLHEVEIDLDVSYWDWVRTGSLEKHIRGWYVFTYQVKRSKGKTDKVLIRKWYEPKYLDMSNFNSLNQQKEFDSLPYDKINTRRSSI